MLDFRNSILKDRRDGLGVKNACCSITRTKVLILAPTSSSQPPVTPDQGVHTLSRIPLLAHTHRHTPSPVSGQASNLTQVYRAPVCLLGQQRQVWCDPWAQAKAVGLGCWVPAFRWEQTQKRNCSVMPLQPRQSSQVFVNMKQPTQKHSQINYRRV